MSKINFLPPWVETNLQPAFYDLESGTCLQQTARMYNKVNELVRTVNNQNEIIADYIEQFNELHDYVYDYFDNLDVQEEINKKLDAMSEDGSLTALIQPYVDAIYQPYQEEINGEIEQFENTVNGTLDNFAQQLTSAVSGNPIPVSSTGDMTDHTKTYLLTSTGKWYYWDGDSWEEGGTYQSVELQNNDVHYANLDTQLQNSIEPYNDLTSIATHSAGYAQADGSITGTTSTSLCYYEFSVLPYETYKVRMMMRNAYSSDKVAIQFLNDSTVIQNITKGDVDVDENYYYEKIFTIPYGVNKVRLNTNMDSLLYNFGIYILKVKNYEVDQISKRQLDSQLQTFFKNEFTEVEPTTFISGAYASNTTVAAYASTTLLSVSVLPHEIYRITGTQVAANPIVIFTTKNNLTVKTIDGNDYNIKNFVDFIQSETSNDTFTEYEFEIPDYCDTIYLNKFNNDSTFKIEKCTSYHINGTDVIDDYDKIGFSKWIAIGDSITEVNYRAAHNYLYYIGQDMQSLTIVNKGASGTGYKNPADTSNTFSDRLNSISAYNADTDVITVMGSVNDIQYVAGSLGQLGDTTTATVYGAMYKFFNDLFTKFNGVRVGCISPINWKNSNTNPDVETYLTALKETCLLFNVPYLDLYHQTNLRPNNATFLNEYYLSDGAGHTPVVDSGGVHPNSKGHRLIYQRIKEFIKTL